MTISKMLKQFNGRLLVNQISNNLGKCVEQVFHADLHGGFPVGVVCFFFFFFPTATGEGRALFFQG